GRVTPTAHPPERAPLLLLPRARPELHPDLGRHRGLPFREWLGDGARHCGAGRKCNLVVVLFAFLPFVPPHSRWPAQAFLPPPGPLQALGVRVQAEREAYANRLGEPGLRCPHGPLCPPGRERVGTRPEVFLMAAEETFEHHSYDVVVIGAGGAGLRAAISAQDSGARTALICRSLLGKAHTVMAEGGIAAAL